jgi:hypothetical protein
VHELHHRRAIQNSPTPLPLLCCQGSSLSQTYHVLGMYPPSRVPSDLRWPRYSKRRVRWVHLSTWKILKGTQLCHVVPPSAVPSPSWSKLRQCRKASLPPSGRRTRLGQEITSRVVGTSQSTPPIVASLWKGLLSRSRIEKHLKMFKLTVSPFNSNV